MKNINLAKQFYKNYKKKKIRGKKMETKTFVYDISEVLNEFPI